MLDRRAFLFTSSGAIAGSFVAAGLPEAAASSTQAPASGLVSGAPKPLRHVEIPGFLSAAQISPHHTAHYGGALTAFKGVEAEYEAALAAGTPIDTARFERLRQLQSSRGNSVILHELYFDGLERSAVTPGATLTRALARRFGSVERWQADFVTSARAAAGWALLVVHPVNGRLYNVVSDEHAQGPMWLAAPVVVLDVYEHAYYIDYQQRKAQYIEKFLAHIDWAEAEKRYQAAGGR
jgi:superoxide dismutase, Fe-Mn family